MQNTTEHIARVAELFEKQPITKRYSLEVMLTFIESKAQDLMHKLHDLEDHALSTCSSADLKPSLDAKLRKALEAERREVGGFY